MRPNVGVTFAFFLAGFVQAYAQPLLEEPAPDSLPGTLSELQWTEREVEDITRIVDGKIFVRARATERMFKDYASKADIIHLATHALIDDENPLYSKFVFTADDDSTNEGYLHTYELYNMQLDAKLAILSACNTGAGKLSRGEGIMSLARGFKYAGCPSIVMSLWPVDDYASAELMVSFYAGLKRGLTKDAALREAKLQYLNNADPRRASPFYWAGYVSLGEPSALDFEQRPTVGWITVVLFFMASLLLSMILWKKYGREY